MPLVTAGQVVAIGLPANFGLAPTSTASALPRRAGYGQWCPAAYSGERDRGFRTNVTEHSG